MSIVKHYHLKVKVTYLKMVFLRMFRLFWIDPLLKVRQTPLCNVMFLWGVVVLYIHDHDSHPDHNKGPDQRTLHMSYDQYPSWILTTT